jgi:hypothetical protein
VAEALTVSVAGTGIAPETSVQTKRYTQTQSTPNKSIIFENLRVYSVPVFFGIETP